MNKLLYNTLYIKRGGGNPHSNKSNFKYFQVRIKWTQEKTFMGGNSTEYP